MTKKDTRKLAWTAEPFEEDGVRGILYTANAGRITVYLSKPNDGDYLWALVADGDYKHVCNREIDLAWAKLKAINLAREALFEAWQLLNAR